MRALYRAGFAHQQYNIIMSALLTPKLSLISRPGYGEASFTLHTSPPPETIADFLAICLEKYEQEYRGWLMIIEYDPQDLLTEDQSEAQSVPANMEALVRQANKMFREQMCGQRQNFDIIPQIAVRNRFTSKGGQISGQKPVFTILTPYRYEPDFNEEAGGKYQDGTYFMPPHYKV